MNINTLAGWLTSTLFVLAGVLRVGIGLLGVIAGLAIFGTVSPFLSVFLIIAGGLFVTAGVMNFISLRE